jgi:hypothetical protein
MGRNVRIDKELREASEHLHYEMWMLASLAHGIIVLIVKYQFQVTRSIEQEKVITVNPVKKYFRCLMPVEMISTLSKL